MEVKIAKTDTELRKVSNVLLQLRSNYHQETLIAQIKEQQENGYQIAYVASDDQVLCVAGFVIGTKLAWGKHIYIDDLVSDERHRSTGVGKFMIDWFKSFALEIGCKQIHLDSGVQRFPVHRFYLREGFNIASHHFSITDINN